MTEQEYNGRQEPDIRLLAGLVRQLEGMRLAEYMELQQKPWRIIYLNFLAGTARGLGMAVGATIVFALLLKALSSLIVLNLPVIGEVVRQIMQLAETKQNGL